MVTIAADGESSDDERIKNAFFIVRPDQAQLLEIGKQLNIGVLKAFVSGVATLNEAADAYGGTLDKKSGPGKMVITLSA
jgi:hypothetical protein